MDWDMQIKTKCYAVMHLFGAMGPFLPIDIVVITIFALLKYYPASIKSFAITL